MKSHEIAKSPEKTADAAIFDSLIKLQTFGFWSFGLGASQPGKTFYAQR
jgi:hypothetical protein